MQAFFSFSSSLFFIARCLPVQPWLFQNASTCGKIMGSKNIKWMLFPLFQIWINKKIVFTTFDVQLRIVISKASMAVWAVSLYILTSSSGSCLWHFRKNLFNQSFLPWQMYYKSCDNSEGRHGLKGGGRMCFDHAPGFLCNPTVVLLHF